MVNANRFVNISVTATVTQNVSPLLFSLML